eukprot:3592670-Rhodomonas_salina.1
MPAPHLHEDFVFDCSELQWFATAGKFRRSNTAEGVICEGLICTLCARIMLLGNAQPCLRSVCMSC